MTGVLDRALYALFSQHADSGRHEDDRRTYRGASVAVSFDVFVARVHGASWLAFLAVGTWIGFLVWILPPSTVDAVARVAGRLSPVAFPVGVPWRAVPRTHVAAAAAVAVGLAAKRGTVAAGSLYLRWAARARRADIRRTLPGAVRYLHVLASGNPDRDAMLAEVAAREGAYGETAVAFRTVLNRAALAGSVEAALRAVARDTPSRELLAPFLLKFREHAAQGADAVEGYLRLESRMLANRQARARQEAEGFLELLAELFIVLLVLPSLAVITLTVVSVLAPSLGRSVVTPVGTTTPRALLVYGCAGFVVVVGLLAAWLVAAVRPAGYGGARYAPSRTPAAVLRRAATNPGDAAVVLAVPAALAAPALLRAGVSPANALLLPYVGFALPVGLVALRRVRRDDAKDREMKDFVHAVAGHVGLGRPFPRAVELVAEEAALDALHADVSDLAFNLGLAERRGATEGVRGAALDRFVRAVGTPLAEQSVGLVSGALDAGSDAETAFEALQAEVGRLYHERKALRSQLLVYVAVGWTTALLVVGIVVVVNAAVLDSFAQLSAVSATSSALAIDPDAVKPARDRYRFYVVAQATMLSCGWFAGTASRGRYEALFHSGVLVAVAYAVFAGVGML